MRVVRGVGWQGAAGALYPTNLLGGAFAITIVPAMVVVQDNPVATAHNLQTHELLYRSGLAAHPVVTTANVFLAVIFTVFFGLDILVFAYLVLRSTFLPRTVGSCW